MLYPLTFTPIFKEKIWGGQKIKDVLGKDFTGTPDRPLPNCGETWEVSGVAGNVSVVAEGPLKGQPLDTLVAEHKAELVGQHVYEKYGDEFPLLVKFIDAADDLSIQVHPNDELALKRHNSFGKTEMWYILEADAGAQLNAGFNRELTKEEYVTAVENGTLQSLLNMENVQAGDVFYLPAGRVHYIGKGILLAEIQQTSDITYRIYDFDRVDDKGQKRELHTEQAVDAIDYQQYDHYKEQYERKLNESVNVVRSPYFITNVLHFDQPVVHDFSHLDSFVILVCVEGRLTIETAGNAPVTLQMGQCALLPASLRSATLTPEGSMTVLESFVP